MQNSKTISDNNALLLYRVGPVLCCSSTHSVESVVVPPAMKKPPGVDELRPGVFRHVSGIVNTMDLRVAFGVDKKQRNSNGRVIIVNLETVRSGFWVDEIIDVIEFPDKGWGQLPALIPRDVFDRVLLLNDKIQLYCDFAKLNVCKNSGYLRDYIERMDDGLRKNDDVISKKKSPDIKGRQVFSSELSSKVDSHNDKPEAEPETETETEESEQARVAAKADDGPAIISVASPDLSFENKPLVEMRQPQTRKEAAGIIDTAVKGGIEKSFSSEDFDVSVSGHKQVDELGHSPSSYNNDVSRSLVTSKEEFSDQGIAQYGSKSMDYADDNDDALKFSAIFIVVAFLLVVAVYYLLDSDLPENEYSVDSRLRAVDVSSLVEIEEQVTTEIETTVADEPVVKVVDVPDNEIIVDPGALGSELDLAKNESRSTESENIMNKGVISIEKDDQGYVIVVDNTDNNSTSVQLGNRVNKEELVAEAEQEILSASDNVGVSSSDKSEDDDLAGMSAAMITKGGTVQVPAVDNDLEMVLISNDIGRSEKSDKSISENKANAKNVNRYQVIHIVVKGDTLWHIASRYINNPYRYPELARLSKISNPDLIYPGDRVKIIIIDRQ
ncbi:MAG: chemotaxis protein CheW [Gammaproteobacteria bacterium]